MKEINKKYDCMTINELESMIEAAFRSARDAQKEMYGMLYYLYTTKRFRQNPRYKKAAFETYLEDRFTIRMGTFRENVKAYVNYPDFAVEYGAGLVTKISNVCGSKKISKVISEITKEEKTRKNDLNRSKIEEIIQRNATPTKVKHEVTDWRGMYEREREAHMKTIESLKAAGKRIIELEDQVRRLKNTVNRIELPSLRGCQSDLQHASI